ncbi:MAG: cytochrome [Bacteroidetes bacterium]|nr:cytochrome [Bacteroidota bacterium]
MNKQKRALELLAILIFIGILGAIVWSSNPYSGLNQSFHKSSDNGPSPSTPHVATAEEKSWLKGKQLFKSNCAACHNPKIAQTGPALMGVTKRWEDAGNYKDKTGNQWLHAWIRNWNVVVSAGYPYAISIKQQYNKSPMNTFPNLKDEDIDAILTYVETPANGMSEKQVTMH